MLKTRITELLEIKHPIIQGGMQGVGVAEMVAAVSNAGGFGVLTAFTQTSPEALAAEIDRCRKMTDKPFGVNMTLFPAINAPNYFDFAQIIIDKDIKVVETAGTAEVVKIWDIFKQNDIKIIHKCTSVRHALSAERKGVDIISIDGFECAGHPGEDDIPGLILIPVTANKVKIPLIASGGFGDGRGLVAALALGADAINMGTRFCATKEAPIHDNVKQKYIENDERGTHLIFRNFYNTARVGKSEVSDEVVKRLAREGATFEDVVDLVKGSGGRDLLETGDLSKGVFWASMAQGLIDDIPTVQELIDKIMFEAEEIINQKLARMQTPA